MNKYVGSKMLLCKDRPQDSLTALIYNQFAQVSLTIWEFFYDAIAKAKKQIHKSMAHNLELDSLTRRFYRFSNSS